MHEIPVELEESDCVGECGIFLGVALCPSDDSPDVFSENAIEVLNICRLDFFWLGVSVNDAAYFIDDATRFSYLDKLSMINRVGSEELWKDDGIVIVPVGKYPKSI